MKHGRGTEKFAYGDFYVGEFTNGRFEGQGEYIWANGNSYLGEFKNGLQNGYGVWKKQQKKADGEIHEGFFVNGQRDGIGITKFQNGNVYRGYFYKDSRHGYGEMSWIDKRCSYRGQWVSGLQSGLGILEFDSEPDPFFGLFSNGVFVEQLSMEFKSSLLEKLASLKQDMEDEVAKFKKDSVKRGNITRILGDTMNSIYNKKLYDIGKVAANRKPARAQPTGEPARARDSSPRPTHDRRSANPAPPARTNESPTRPNNSASRIRAPNTALARKLPGLQARNNRDRSFNQYRAENSPERLRRDRSFQAEPNIGSTIDSDSQAKPTKIAKPFQYYKGRTTYLDSLINEKLKINPPINGKKSRPILIKENRPGRPAWRPSGKNNQNLGGNIIV